MLRKITITAALMLVASVVWAHGDGLHPHQAGLLAGVSHPLGGLDHVLAFVAVGLWAAQTGGRALWVLPLTFLGVMSFGCGLAVLGVTMPAVEAAIALSVLLGGVVIALRSRGPLSLACAVTGFFALFHGVAHGIDVQQSLTPWAYGTGMLTATAFLLSIGVLAGIKTRELILRVAGGLISLAGVALVFTQLG